MSTGKRLRQLRKNSNKTQNDIAKALYVTPSSIGMYERDERVPSSDVLMGYAKLFNTSTDYILGIEKYRSDSNNYITINVYGKVPAGIPIEAIEDIQDTEELSLKDYQASKDYLGLIVDGDSMYPKYLKGDTIIVEVTPQCENGEDCVVYVNGYDATLKTVIKNEDGSITLQPINPSYPPTTYGIDDEPIKILGKVKEIRRKI
nr:MAG TPA: Repressor protein CI [Caudoviricetes sp.]